MKKMLYFSVVLLLLFQIGCGKTTLVSAEQARKLAERSSPIVEIEDQDRTLPGPIKWVLTGKDKDGKKLFVWVTTSVQGYLYLDTGISSANAVAKIQELGFNIKQKPILFGPENPKWRVITETTHDTSVFYWVDFYSGKIEKSPTSN
jgi:uncharacterized protein YpmB